MTDGTDGDEWLTDGVERRVAAWLSGSDGQSDGPAPAEGPASGSHPGVPSVESPTPSGAEAGPGTEKKEAEAEASDAAPESSDRDDGSNRPDARETTDRETSAPTDHGDAAATAGSEVDGSSRTGQTTVFTWAALQRLADPADALREASGWSDWLGVVGDIRPRALNDVEREAGVRADFVDGPQVAPEERLSAIAADSEHDSERLVCVGLPEEASVRAVDGWEFVPLSEAAERAGWDLEA